MIHPTAIVEPGAELGTDVEVMAGAVVTRWVRLGDGVVVHPGAVVGGDPQYLKFQRDTRSYVEVGEGTIIREHVTINRSINSDGVTRVGARCLLMASSHVAHDCEVGDEAVIANAALLAGHVVVGSLSFVGGGVGVHQFCRIGTLAMIGGLARVTRDVPPYTMVAERDELIGLNVVGVKRRGWPRESVREVKELYRQICLPGGNPRELAAARAGDVQSVEGQTFLAFFAGGKRGFCRPRRSDAAAEEGE